MAKPDVQNQSLTKNNSHRRGFLGVITLVACEPEMCPMPNVTYEIVQHDGGWAYKVNGVFSEPFSTHAEAVVAAQAAAEEQEIPGPTETIEYEEEKGEGQQEN